MAVDGDSIMVDVMISVVAGVVYFSVVVVSASVVMNASVVVTSGVVST